MSDKTTEQNGTEPAFDLNKLVEAIDDDIKAFSYNGSLESARSLKSLLERAIRAKQSLMRVAAEAAKNEIVLRFGNGENVSADDLAWALREQSYEDER